MFHSFERTFTAPVYVATLAILCAWGSRAYGQLPTLRPGINVRVRATSLARVHEGSVVRSNPDTLVVRLDMGGPPLAIPDRDVITLAMSHGHPGFGRRFAIGAVLGLGIGLVIATNHSRRDGILCDFGTDCPQPHSDAGWQALFVVGSAALGGFVAQIGSREQWETVIDRRR